LAATDRSPEERDTESPKSWWGTDRATTHMVDEVETDCCMEFPRAAECHLLPDEVMNSLSDLRKPPAIDSRRKINPDNPQVCPRRSHQFLLHPFTELRMRDDPNLMMQCPTRRPVPGESGLGPAARSEVASYDKDFHFAKQYHYQDPL
jgi:hypothetical protein